MTKKAIPKGVTTRGAGRVGFLANRAAITKMVDEGHTLISIYTSLYGPGKAKPKISYEQFTRYIARFIRGESNDKQPSIRKAPAAAAKAGGAVHNTAREPSGATGEEGFVFDPKTKPKSDLF